jgi:hypothetical protein
MAGRELDLLLEGKDEEVSQLAEKRRRIIDRALEHGAGPGSQQVLAQLLDIQERLTDEARKLHSSVRDELVKIKQESRRHNGYHKAVKPGPLVRNRFINKKG